MDVEGCPVGAGGIAPAKRRIRTGTRGEDIDELGTLSDRRGEILDGLGVPAEALKRHAARVPGLRRLWPRRHELLTILQGILEATDGDIGQAAAAIELFVRRLPRDGAGEGVERRVELARLRQDEPVQVLQVGTILQCDRLLQVTASGGEIAQVDFVDGARLVVGRSIGCKADGLGQQRDLTRTRRLRIVIVERLEVQLVRPIADTPDR